jgi:hypothetical protein
LFLPGFVSFLVALGGLEERLESSG